jgi:hypothetical protein
MPTYDPYKRLEVATWLLAHIQTLINSAKGHRDSTMAIYACFETRNFLEKLEFYIIAAALTEEERKKHFKDLEKMWGLNTAFGTIIQEKAYTYITFMNALCKAKNLPFRHLGQFDFKASNRFKLELNAYCHLYSRLQPDLEFDSEFIQKGLVLPDRVFTHLKEKKVLDEVEGINIVGISVSELKGDSLIILERLRKKEIKTEEELVELLRHSKNY